MESEIESLPPLPLLMAFLAPSLVLAGWLKPSPRMCRTGRYLSGGSLLALGVGAALLGNRK